MISDRVNNAVTGYKAISERIICVRINGASCHVNIIQAYAPTAGAGDEEVENVYASLKTLINEIPNREIVIILGDLNAKVGRTHEDN
ncbi:hypothetical protein HUJ05_007750 [Dendroctonus ponderosae]|nr:hypothetical protein HUJ05_007750 [Dendroctonus ponderosae]